MFLQIAQRSYRVSPTVLQSFLTWVLKVQAKAMQPQSVPFQINHKIPQNNVLSTHQQTRFLGYRTSKIAQPRVQIPKKLKCYEISSHISPVRKVLGPQIPHSPHTQTGSWGSPWAHRPRGLSPNTHRTSTARGTVYSVNSKADCCCGHSKIGAPIHNSSSRIND